MPVACKPPELVDGLHPVRRRPGDDLQEDTDVAKSIMASGWRRQWHRVRLGSGSNGVSAPA